MTGDEHTQHLYRLLMAAGADLRAFQMYEIGRGHGSVAESVNRDVLQALERVWNAANTIQRAGTPDT